MRLLLCILGWGWWALALPAQAAWKEALRHMPLSTATPLNRDDYVPTLLSAFQSNQTVKALVFLPGVSDDFYLINTDAPKLNIKAGNLLAAISALTNATAVRATFRAPLLLLHLERDWLEPRLTIKDQATARRLKLKCGRPHVLWNDTHWERLQPLLQDALKIKVLPAAASPDAWHFARHNMAAWNLPDWNLLAALSLTGRTTISIERNHLSFALPDSP